MSFTVYQNSQKLTCHVCDTKKPLLSMCSQCGSRFLKKVGLGTEGLHEHVQLLFPQARILRMDRDEITTTKKLNQTLEQFQKHQADMLIGTQMLVKGHDFPKLTLVVVVLADSLFSWPDFRANEKAYATLKQVAGRAGRAQDAGLVLVQTYSPEHPVLQLLTEKMTEKAFFEEELSVRQFLRYPPFGRIARLRFEQKTKQKAFEQSHVVLEGLHKQALALEILGPSEAFLEKAKGLYRFDMLIKSSSVFPLHQALYWVQRLCESQKWAFWVDVDPWSL
jgi:primosomal protein N' (replication factor Y)